MNALHLQTISTYTKKSWTFDITFGRDCNNDEFEFIAFLLAS
ncbi:hypothetical protein HanPI659440_Chr09g0344351 [Helianthus annuus]|nr:hypothetical protein HanPI659440_Chr09g0344351 [Helianthus annuus]